MLPAKTSELMRLARLRNTVNQDFSVTQEIIRAQRELSYERMWRLAHDKKWFHIQFEDLSIIQFQNYPSPSYHLIECPLDVPPLSEFLAGMNLDYRTRHNADITELYDEAIDTANLRKYVTPIRYDRDFGSYRQGIHPAAHIHIGLDNNVRLALSREMTPWSFLLFIIRQRYPENWERLLGGTFSKSLRNSVRDNLPLVPIKYWDGHDFSEIALS
jgi:hypothetical protein